MSGGIQAFTEKSWKQTSRNYSVWIILSLFNAQMLVLGNEHVSTKLLMWLFVNYWIISNISKYLVTCENVLVNIYTKALLR